MYLEEERERSACEKEPGSRPPTATKIHSGWIKNLNVKGTTCGRKCEMVYAGLLRETINYHFSSRSWILNRDIKQKKMAGESKLFLLLIIEDAGFTCGQEAFLVLTLGSGSHLLDMVREAVPSRAAETTCPLGVARYPREEGWAGLGLSKPCSQTLR